LKDIIIGLALGSGLKRNYCSGTNLFNPWFVTGFTDGEGSFIVQLYKSSAYRLGWSVEPQFTICLNLPLPAGYGRVYTLHTPAGREG
jgi:hypothetical protein